MMMNSHCLSQKIFIYLEDDFVDICNVELEKDLPFAGLLSTLLQWPGLGQVMVRGQEPHLGVSYW